MTKTDIIRELNDKLRRGEIEGRFMVMGELASEGEETIMAALLGVRNFANFKPRNDPYEEHDFGTFMLGDRKVMFKIDYYSKDDMDVGSEDPSDPTITTRVLTIFYAEDY